MNDRGQYGRSASRNSCTSRGALLVGAALRSVPVVDLDVESPQPVIMRTSRLAVWDPDVEQIAGGGPSYYTERDGGWWYFYHPQGEVWIEGRPFRPVKPRGIVTVIEAGTHVGQASFFGHTPGEVEDELDQLHGELMCFGQEVIELTQSGAQVTPELKQLRDDEAAAWKVVDSFQALVRERDRLQKLLPGSSKEYGAAQTALEKFMPAARRAEAVARARDLSDRRAALEATLAQGSPIVQWAVSAWTPFFDGWRKFRESKKDIPLQTLPGSGVWDRIQEYRKQFIDLRKNAPFKSRCPEPLDPTRRTDPSLTGIFGDVGSILKWGVIGALGIGGVIALSSAVSNLRRGRSPVEPYAQIVRGRRRARE